jgi:hypothetical protein
MTTPPWYAIYRALESLDEAITAGDWTASAAARLLIYAHKKAPANDVRTALAAFRYKYDREPKGDFVWRATWQQQLQS